MASMLSRNSSSFSPLSSVKKVVWENPNAGDETGTGHGKKPAKPAKGKKSRIKNSRKRRTKSSTSAAKPRRKWTASDATKVNRSLIAFTPLAKVTRLIADFIAFRKDATERRLAAIERYSDEAYTLRMELMMFKRPDFVKVVNGGQLRVRECGSATSGELFDRIADEIKRCKTIKTASRGDRYRVDSRKYHAAAASVSVYMGLLQFLSDRLKSETIKP